MSGLAIIVRELLADAAVHALVGERILPHQAHEQTAPPLLSAHVVDSAERAPVSLAHTVAHVTERVQVDAVVSHDRPADLAPLLAAVHAACSNKVLPHACGVSDVVIRYAGRGPQLPDEQRRLYVQSIDFMVSFNQQR